MAAATVTCHDTHTAVWCWCCWCSRRHHGESYTNTVKSLLIEKWEILVWKEKNNIYNTQISGVKYRLTGECRSGLTGCTWNAMAQASQVRILSHPKIYFVFPDTETICSFLGTLIHFLLSLPPEQQTTACYTLGKQDLRTSKIVSTDPKTCSWSSPKEYVIAFSRRWAYPTGECRSGLTGCTWNAMAQASQVRILSRPKIFLLHRLPGKGLRHGLPSSGKFLEKEGDFINRMQINKEIRRLHGPRNLSIHR